MTRLVLRELAAGGRIWLGVIAVTAVAAGAIALPAALLETAAGAPLLQALAIWAVVGIVVTLTAIAAIVVLGSVSRLAVQLQRRTHALWQVVGIAPAGITRVVLAQLVILAVLGGILGCLLASLVATPVIVFELSALQGIDAVTPRFGVGTAAIVVALVAVIVLMAALPAARAAARVTAVQVLRDPEPERRPRRWPRIVLASGWLALAALMTVSLRSATLSTIGSQVLLIGPLLTAAMAALGPVLTPPLLHGWTSAAGPRWIAWNLARRQLLHARGRAVASVNAVLIGIALPGGLFAGQAVVSAVTGTAGGLSASAVLLLLGGPILLSLVGASSSQLMASGARDRENALLVATGGTPRLLFTVAGLEAIMSVLTAAISGALVIVATGLMVAWGLSGAAAPGAVPRFDPGVSVLVGLVALVLLAAATLIPTAIGLRRPVRELLSA